MVPELWHIHVGLFDHADGLAWKDDDDGVSASANKFDSPFQPFGSCVLRGQELLGPDCEHLDFPLVEKSCYCLGTEKLASYTNRRHDAKFNCDQHDHYRPYRGPQRCYDECVERFAN
jgi:hypothetical protein